MPSTSQQRSRAWNSASRVSGIGLDSAAEHIRSSIAAGSSSRFVVVIKPSTSIRYSPGRVRSIRTHADSSRKKRHATRGSAQVEVSRSDRTKSFFPFRSILTDLHLSYSSMPASTSIQDLPYRRQTAADGTSETIFIDDEDDDSAFADRPNRRDATAASGRPSPKRHLADATSSDAAHKRMRPSGADQSSTSSINSPSSAPRDPQPGSSGSLSRTSSLMRPSAPDNELDYMTMVELEAYFDFNRNSFLDRLARLAQRRHGFKDDDAWRQFNAEFDIMLRYRGTAERAPSWAWPAATALRVTLCSPTSQPQDLLRHASRVGHSHRFGLLSGPWRTTSLDSRADEPRQPPDSLVSLPKRRRPFVVIGAEQVATTSGHRIGLLNGACSASGRAIPGHDGRRPPFERRRRMVVRLRPAAVSTASRRSRPCLVPTATITSATNLTTSSRAQSALGWS